MAGRTQRLSELTQVHSFLIRVGCEHMFSRATAKDETSSCMPPSLPRSTSDFGREVHYRTANSLRSFSNPLPSFPGQPLSASEQNA